MEKILNKLDLFVKLTVWLKRGVIGFYISFAATFLVFMQFYEVYKGYVASNQISWGLLVFTIFLLILASPALIPIYKIIHYLGDLLNIVKLNFIKNESTFLLPSNSFRLFKKYSIIQCLLNSIFYLYDYMKSPHPNTESFANFIFENDWFVQSAYIFEFGYVIFDWIFPSLSNSMPLYFLGFIYIIAFIYDENLKLKSELSEVI
jgi:hypothetical protein